MKFVGCGGQLLTPIRRCLYRCIQYPPECHIIYAINQLIDFCVVLDCLSLLSFVIHLIDHDLSLFFRIIYYYLSLNIICWY